MTSVRHIALGYNNVYLVRSNETSVLIDAGPDYRGAGAALLRETRAAAPGTIIVTHGHLDHAGLARWWQEQGASVSSGTGDEHFASTAQFGDQQELAAFERYVEEIGTPDAVAREVLRGFTNAGIGRSQPRPKPASTARRYGTADGQPSCASATSSRTGCSPMGI